MAHPLDQKSWQALTTWAAHPPGYSKAWELLTDGALPASFHEDILTLKHPFLRKLRLGADSTIVLPSEPMMEARSWNNRFANLVSGRFTELLFHRTYAGEVEAKGLHLTETTTKHDWFDYLLDEPSEGFTLGNQHQKCRRPV